MLPEKETSDFGLTLKAAREARGLTLQELSDSTKISVSVLRALEDSEVSRLPGGVFGRSFVRVYASEVGLDPDSTVELFVQKFEQFRSTRVERKVGRREGALRESKFSPAMVRVSVIALLVAVFLVFYFYTVLSVGGMLQDESSSTIGAEHVTARPLIVSFYTTGPSWVSLMVDDEQVFAGVIEAGREETFEAMEKIFFSVGNAGNFHFSINGMTGRSLGTEGISVTADINQENLNSFLAR